MIPLVLHSFGAPLGEPAADDIECLHLVYFTRGLPLFSGYGSIFYWRPLSRQLYFKLLAPLMLPQPALIAALHIALFALASLLLYRALRGHLGGAFAALAASFPSLMESSRIAIAWPSNFQDLGPMLFAAVAIHEAVAGRLATTLAAVLASLLSKEVGAVAFLLLPWLPARERRDRIRWFWAIAATVAVWGIAYAVVHRSAGLRLPPPGNDPAAAPTLRERGLWAFGNAARTAMSLPVAPSGLDGLAGGALLLIALSTVVAARVASARLRMAPLLGWAVWGAAWFAAGTLPIAAAYPYWLPCRMSFAGIGAGIALTALAGAAHPALAVVLLALRLALLAFSPGPPRQILVRPEERGAWLDFQKLARLQMLMRQTREALQHRYPGLPHGAMVGQLNMPMAAEFSFFGSKTLQVWYRDTTLRWVRFEDYSRRPDYGLTTIVQYQDRGPRQVTLVEPTAMSAMQHAYDHLDAGDFPAALRDADRADSLQSDRDSRTFLGNVAGLRAICLTTEQEPEAAEREARRALDLWPASPEARLALAQVWSDRGEVSRAEAALREVLFLAPNHEVARFMLERLHARTAPPADSIH